MILGFLGKAIASKIITAALVSGGIAIGFGVLYVTKKVIPEKKYERAVKKNTLKYQECIKKAIKEGKPTVDKLNKCSPKHKEDS